MMSKLPKKRQTTIYNPTNRAGVAPVIDSWMGILALLICVGLLIPRLAQAAAIAIYPAGGSMYQAVALICQQILLAVFTLWHFRINLRLYWSDFGLRKFSFRQVLGAIYWGCWLLALNGAGVWLSRNLATWLFGPGRALAMFYREESVLMGVFRYDSSLPALLLLTVAVVFGAAITEELFFRGYLYAALKAKLGRHAIWVSSALFTAVHLYVIHAIPVFLLALALTALYERRGVLWENVMAHAVLNGLVVIFLIAQRG